MWRKIISQRQLEILKVGDIVIKYPVDGTVEEDFEKATSESISPRVISENDRDDKHMRISFLHSKSPSDPILGMYRGLLAPVLKTYNEMIEEGTWWMFYE